MENVTNWYDAVPYADIKNIIRDRVTAMAREYIGIGFFLRKVRDNEMYLEDGYKDIHDFAMNEFGMSKSTVNHCIRINEQFSIDGNSPDIDERYKGLAMKNTRIVQLHLILHVRLKMVQKRLQSWTLSLI